MMKTLLVAAPEMVYDHGQSHPLIPRGVHRLFCSGTHGIAHPRRTDIVRCALCSCWMTPARTPEVRA